jgi:RNA polymerase sigma factor (sigma-70 family)
MGFIKAIQEDDRTDAGLVAAYRGTGDLKVLAQLYQRYMDLVHGVCLKYLEDPEAAKDAVMQIFEELVVKLRNHEVANFRSWLHVLTRNHCLMQLRAAKKLRTTDIDPELVQSADDGHLNGQMEKEEQLARMEDCIGTLPEEQRESIRLFYLEQKSYNQITELTGMEWNLVRSQIQNGRRNLRNCMEKKEKGTRSTNDPRI